MKILYVACNPSDANDLMIDSEVTDLQLRLTSARGEPVQFVACPQLPLEALGLQINAHKPDVLHVSAHGERTRLEMANADGQAVAVTGELLRRFLDVDPAPRLVYLNACNSCELARTIISVVPSAVGTTAPITNRSARASALLFYDRILSGATLQNAYEAGAAVMQCLQREKVKSRLYCQKGVDPCRERLHDVPRIVAKFDGDDCEPSKSGYFDIVLGVVGCPVDTAQIVFFTDDPSFLGDEEEDDEREVAAALCRVVRTYPVRHAVWSEGTESVIGDYRVFAAGITTGGRSFIAESTLCRALEDHYTRMPASNSPPRLSRSLERLRREDGSALPVQSSGPKKQPEKRR